MPPFAILEKWSAISRPAVTDELAAGHVDGTNAWVYKDKKGGFGFVLTGVDPPMKDLDLRNIIVRYKPEKIFATEGRTRAVQRCLEVGLDPKCEPEALAIVLERLSVRCPGGAFDTATALEVLVDAAELFLPAGKGPTKEEVLGAWGELYLIETLMKSAKTPDARLEIVRAWEAEGGRRDILDLRFGAVGIAMEVKTTVSSRIHHLHGYEQVAVPVDFSEGYLVSIRANEERPGIGRSNMEMCSALRALAIGSRIEQKRLSESLDAKFVRRGSACSDDRYRYSSSLEQVALVRFENVPRPGKSPNVSGVEWSANLESSAFLGTSEKGKVLSLASGSSVRPLKD